MSCTIQEHIADEARAHDAGYKQGLTVGHEAGFNEGYIIGTAEAARSTDTYRIAAVDTYRDGYVDCLGDLRAKGWSLNE